MSAPAITSALVAALAADADALDLLAAALAPRLATVATATTGALTTRQAAERAGLHERTIRRALTARMLDGHVIAGRWRVELDALDAWLHRGAPTSTTPTHDNGRPRHSATAGADAIAGSTREAA